MLLFSFLYKYDDLSGTCSARPPKSLNHADRGSQAVVADDQIDVADVKAFFKDICGYKSVKISMFESLQQLGLLLLGQAVLILANKDLTFDELASPFVEMGLDIPGQRTILAKDDGLGGTFTLLRVSKEAFQDISELTELWILIAAVTLLER